MSDCFLSDDVLFYIMLRRMYGALTGLSKQMVAQRHGPEILKKWRRGYATRPPPISSFSASYPGLVHYSDVPCYIVSYHTIPCYTTLHYTTLHYTPYHVMLHYYSLCNSFASPETLSSFLLCSFTCPLHSTQVMMIVTSATYKT